MILGRIAFFFALLFGLATTQLPEFMQQYRQRLGGAVDEITAIIARFDNDARDNGLTENAAIAQLEKNPDPLVKARGVDMERLIKRLNKLETAQTALESSNTIEKWTTFVTSFDGSIATRAYETYQPAVPTTWDGLIAGAIGFVVGGGLAHLFGLPIRYRHKLFRRHGKHNGTAGGPATYPGRGV
jgi:hypothetical protein